MPKGNASPRTLRTVWLVMFNQGGWWTSAQLRKELPKLPKHDCFPTVVAATLSNAAIGNYLAVRKAEPGYTGNQYAVLSTCHVPRCVTVGEVLM